MKTGPTKNLPKSLHYLCNGDGNINLESGSKEYALSEKENELRNSVIIPHCRNDEWHAKQNIMLWLVRLNKQTGILIETDWNLRKPLTLALRLAEVFPSMKIFFEEPAVVCPGFRFEKNRTYLFVAADDVEKNGIEFYLKKFLRTANRKS